MNTHLYRRIISCMAIVIAAVSPGYAQLPGTIRTTMKSGLVSFYELHSANVMVSEIGDSGASSNVRIELRDDKDALLASVEDLLQRGHPVRLRKQISAGRGLVSVRIVVRIDRLVDGGSVPVTVFEDLGPDSLIARIIVCGPPGDRGGGQEMCPGVQLTTTGG